MVAPILPKNFKNFQKFKFKNFLALWLRGFSGGLGTSAGGPGPGDLGTWDPGAWDLGPGLGFGSDGCLYGWMFLFH